MARPSSIKRSIMLLRGVYCGWGLWGLWCGNEKGGEVFLCFLGLEYLGGRLVCCPCLPPGTIIKSLKKSHALSVWKRGCLQALNTRDY
jgi:hypothetical protein